jgi:ribosomal protein L11 methylase PrmA
LITANLRYPTLRRLCSHITGITEKKGAVVASGITSDEVEALVDAYTRNGFQCTWKAGEKGWAGVVLKKDSSYPN